MESSSKEDLSLSYADYQRFSKLLLERCGLFFSENRRSEMEYRLRLAFAASTCATLDEFYDLLQDAQSGTVEMDILVNAITISETHFFRDTPQFNALWSSVLPKIIERKQALRTLRIWSAGCASGEEPYSIAIMLRELIPDLDNWSITILGTDINTGALDKARQAVYGNWAFREDRALQLRPRYFRQNGNRYELLPEIRRMVLFSKINLVEPCYPQYETNTTAMDLILCRNVTIYFSEAVTRWVVDRMYDCLVDGGWLIVGRSEPSIDIYRRFRARNFPGSILYQRMPETSKLRWPLAPGAATPPAYIPPPPIVDPIHPPKQTGILPPLPDSGLISTVNSMTSAGLGAKPATAPIPTTPVNRAQQPESPIEQAKELLEYGRSDDALKILLRLANERKVDVAVYTLLGQTYANLSSWKEAEMWCRRAIEADKLAMQAYYTMALIYQHNDRLDLAIDTMKKVVYIERNYILGHYGLANLCHESGMVSQALKSLDNAMRLLAGMQDDQIIPGSRGVTAGRLRSAIIRQQQAWSIG